MLSLTIVCQNNQKKCHSSSACGTHSEPTPKVQKFHKDTNWKSRTVLADYGKISYQKLIKKVLTL